MFGQEQQLAKGDVKACRKILLTYFVSQKKVTLVLLKLMFCKNICK